MKNKKNKKNVISYHDATQMALGYDVRLRADDKRFNMAVEIVHDDGSILFYRNAFLANIGEQYQVVFTEHHGYHVFDKDDLLGANQFVASYDITNIVDEK